jgi:23S rRNA (cytosine1962-C5)-methyltransferase
MADPQPQIPDAPPSAYPVLKMLPGRHKRVRGGHPWVFSNEIDMTAEAKALPPGGLVKLNDGNGGPIGIATFSPHPLVSARLLTREADRRVDADFIALRLERALALRDRLFAEPFYRLIWSEADRLPGLVVDRFGDTAVIQANTAGMDRLMPEILQALDAVVAPTNVVLRNDSAGRRLEGLAEEVIVAKGAVDGPIEVVENGVRFLCDVAGGQKTGWFYDHRENHGRIAALSGGRRVLDVYSYLGGFGIQAAAAGAEVVAVDSSEPALELARRSAELNGVAGRVTFHRAEAFAELARLGEAGETFDVVVADPPAFVKSKRELKPGLKGYRKLTRLAASLVASEGLLFVASCSHNVDAAAFAEIVRSGLRDARRGGRILFSGSAAPDHPVHPYLPESAYLKGMLLQLD